jgi:thiamine kinase-like enzyme
LFSINRSERSNLFLANFQKLNDLSHKIKKLNFKDLTKCIEYLISDIKRIEQLSELEQTLSHGDLTLDNILIDTNHEIWLVDSLDNDSPHYFYDIAKLYQDLEGHWGYLYNFIPFNPISNVALCHELLTEKIRKTFKLYSKYHYYFLGLTFLRIVPYVLRSPILEPVKERALRFLDNFMKGAEL